MSMHLKKSYCCFPCAAVYDSPGSTKKIFCWNTKQVIKHHLCATFTVVLICHYKTIQLGQQKGRLYFLSAVFAQINCFILT